MSKINTKLSSFTMRLSALLLMWLGYSCTEEGDMYGTPIGTFEIKGKVVDENNNAVNEAIIKVTEANEDSNRDYLLAGLTNILGDYHMQKNIIPITRLKVVCKPTDSSLLPDSTIIEVKYVLDKEDKYGWYEGIAEATVDFTLKKKPTEE